MNRLSKSALIGLGAIVLTTVGIGASDIANNVRSNLTGMVIDSSVSGPCAPGSVLVQLGESTICADIFEASAGEQCPVSDPTNEIDTRSNFDTAACLVSSAPGHKPWRFISFTEAQQMCARDGKRLMNSDEWYKLASGMANFDTCNVDSKDNSVRVGTEGQCLSPSGVSDLIGNVWEWLEGEVVDGSFGGRALPGSGYVSGVDTSGIALTTTDTPDSNYGKDYAFTSQAGVKGIIRGGFYGSGEDAGLFALNASVNLDLRTAGVGFRCVKDVY